MMNVDAVELRKPDKFGHIAHYLWLGSCGEKIVLRLRRAVPIRADVVADKLKTFQEDEALLQAQR